MNFASDLLWFRNTEIDWIAVLETLSAISGVLLIALLVYLVVAKVVLRTITAVIRRSSTWWDDELEKNKVFDRLAVVAPALVVRWGINFVPNLNDEVVDLVHRVVVATVVVVIARALSAILSAINEIYARYDVARGRPIKSYIQVAQIIIYMFATISMLAALMNESPWYFLTGLGAMTAVLLLIFRDTLLSLVAGIQLTSNDLIRVGDWIEMPNFGADGDVVDIALNVVKVQNWDRTITVVPTHKFLEHSFKNWRSMSEGGGRRIKRSILIDMTSVRFLNEDEIEKFAKIQVLGEYIARKREELITYNSNLPEGAGELMVNKRWLTNIGTLRAYIAAYLRAHPQIHQQLTFLIRQLQPTQHGIPMEIYVFTSDTRWTFYEGIQSDIFDHLLAILPEFGLRVFQSPTGFDFQRVVDASKD